MSEKKKPANAADQLFTLRATMIAGNATDEFIEENPVVSRTIEIKGSQTLKTLHYAIFESVEFEDEHLYQFEIGGKKPFSKNATVYALQPPVGSMGGLGAVMFGEMKKEKGVTQTKISSLGLKPKQKFFYWFDFGDDWWWEIVVLSIGDEVTKGKYPRVIERVGENPPQYVDWDAEEEDEFEERD